MFNKGCSVLPMVPELWNKMYFVIFSGDMIAVIYRLRLTNVETY